MAKNIAMVGFNQLTIKESIDVGINVQLAYIDSDKRFSMPNFEFPTFNYSKIKSFNLELLDIIPPNHLESQKIFDLGFEAFRRHYFREKFDKLSDIRHWNDVNNLFHMYTSLFYTHIINNKIDSVFFSNIPHEGPYYILYSVAKVLGLRVYICKFGPHPGTFWVADGLEDFGFFETITGAGVSYNLPEKPETPFYMKWNDIDKNRQNVAKVFCREFVKLLFKTIFLTFLWDASSFKRSFWRLIVLRDKLRFISTKKEMKIEQLNGIKFVYFPLHRQPECSADSQGFEFGDQILAIERLRELLPDDVFILVKENPKQVRHARSKSFTDRIRLIKNTIYTTDDIPTFQIIERSIAVATLAGTAGFEAMLLGKPVILFGLTWYNSSPFCYNYRNMPDINEILQTRVERVQLEEWYAEQTKKLYPGIIEEAFSHISDPDPCEWAPITAKSIHDIIMKDSI